MLLDSIERDIICPVVKLHMRYFGIVLKPSDSDSDQFTIPGPFMVNFERCQFLETLELFEYLSKNGCL